MRRLGAVLLCLPALCAAGDFTPFKAHLDESTPVYKHPDLLTAERDDCVPDAGSQVRVIAQEMMPGTPQSVSKVDVFEGNCRGVKGWLLTTHVTRVSDPTPKTPAQQPVPQER